MAIYTSLSQIATSFTFSFARLQSSNFSLEKKKRKNNRDPKIQGIFLWKIFLCIILHNSSVQFRSYVKSSRVIIRLTWLSRQQLCDYRVSYLLMLKWKVVFHVAKNWAVCSTSNIIGASWNDYSTCYTYRIT